MAYIITEPCKGTCDTACVEVCPVDCIEGPIDIKEIQGTPDDERPVKLASIQLFINPEECINCGACEPECPVEAIYEEEEVPSKWEHFIDLNANFDFQN